MPASAVDDLADVKASLTGDGRAYTRLIGRHQAAIAKRMTRFGRGRAQIEELTHDVFVEAYLSLRSFKATAPFEHWLQRIATRVGYRHWQKTKNQKAATLTAADGAIAPPGDQANEVLERLEQLPPRDRLVLTLLYIESRTVAEAAELAGWSQTMVKVQAFRARAKLRRLLAAAR